MRTNVSALVTLYAIIRNPFGNIYSYTTFFESGCSLWERSVFATKESTYRQIIALHTVYRLNHILDKIRNVAGIVFGSDFNCLPFGRDIYFNNFGSSIDSSNVHTYDFIAFAAKSLLDSGLHRCKSQFVRNYTRYFEKCSLQNSVSAVTETNFFGNCCSINGVEPYFVHSHVFFHVVRKAVSAFVSVPDAVQQECSSFF